MIRRIGRMIRKGWVFLANLSLEKKLILIFVFLLSLPITYVSYLSARSTFDSVLQNATNNAIQMAVNASKHDRQVRCRPEAFDRPSLYNSDVQYYLEQETTDWGKNVAMGMFLSYLSHTKKEIAAVYLVDRYEHIFFDKRPDITELSTKEQLGTWKRLVDQQSGAHPILMGRHSIRVNGNKEKAVFSVLRTVKSASTLQDIGIIVFDIDIGLFQDIAEPMDRVTKAPP
ncbi:hypothetical protein VQ056_07040 [Paenibacillus sp. JTLBN-2024]